MYRERAKRTVLGYCDPQTVRPGDTVEFMVSTFAEGAYRANLVQLINADTLSPAGRFREIELDSTFAGDYDGSQQDIFTGSFIEINTDGTFDEPGAFTAALHFRPTTTHKGEQFLLSRWDAEKKTGWAITLNEHGFPCFLLGDSSGTVISLSSQVLAADNEWSYVAVSFCPQSAQAQIFTTRATPTGNTLLDWPVRRQCDLPQDFSPVQSGAIRVAAARGGPGNVSRERPAGVFNGKIQRPRLFRGVPDIQGPKTLGAELAELGQIPLPSTLSVQLVADWDFSREIGSTRIIDVGPNRLHGSTINLPLRAVKGKDWTGETQNWQDAPEQYDAICFHDDDLYDAEWTADFSYKIPPDLKSGLYAARLEHGDSVDHICFFVAPPLGTTTSPIALLMPSAHYMAYGNHTLSVSWADRFPKVYMSKDDEQFLSEHPELGKSLYCYHRDQSEVNYSSRLRPMIHHRPGGQAYNFVADTDIIDWLDHENIAFDVITDELLDQEGVDLLERYQVVLTGTHPEYVTTNMLDATEIYVNNGGRLMYLGGNGFYWVTSFHQELPGVIEVRRMMDEGEGRHEFDGVPGSLWMLNDRPPQKLLGVGFVSMAFFGPTFYQRQQGLDDSVAGFVFEGINDDVIGNFGNHFGGAAGEEIDRTDPDMGTPDDTIVLARTDRHAEILEPDEGYNNEDAYAEMTLRNVAGGGAVFSTGSIAWCSALNHNDFDNNVAALTRNVLLRFLDPSSL